MFLDMLKNLVEFNIFLNLFFFGECFYSYILLELWLNKDILCRVIIM